MDVSLINPFLNATLRVLETMANIKAKAGKPFLKKDNVARGDISGIIGLTGEKSGSIVFSLSSDAAIKIVSSMLYEEFTELNAEVKDAIGELTNIISGDARRELSEKGHIFEGGTPTLVTGKGHEINSITKGPVVAIPFMVDGAPFLVEVSFED